MKYSMFLSITTLLIFCFSCKKSSNGPTVLNEIVFQKADGTIYNFLVKQGQGGYPASLTDSKHGLVITVTTQSAASGTVYVSGISITANQTTVSAVTIADSINVLNNIPSEKTIQSVTADTTLLYNLGNIGYSFGDLTYSYTASAQPINYYVDLGGEILDSFQTGVTGVYDTSQKWLYGYNPNQAHSGDYYYVDPDDALVMWVTECAIGFCHSTFGDISSYLSRRDFGVSLAKEGYYKDDSLSATYTYQYSINSGNYFVNAKQITDNNNKVSGISYIYNN